MIWGYAGVWPGEFGVWDGDKTMKTLKFITEHGFQSAHLSLHEMRDPARAELIGSYVAEHDLRITVGFHTSFFDPDVDVPRRAGDQFLEELQKYGDALRVPIVTMGVGPYHRFMDSPTLAEQLDRLTEVLTPVAKACHDLDRPLGIENHGDYYCDDLVELCKRVPHMNIFLDTGNTYLAGEQSLAGCKAAAPYTIGTHFKDHYVHPDPGELKFVIEGAPLGAGHVGLREVYGYLMELAPNPEKLVMQWEMVPPKGMDAFECLEKSWAFVREITEE